MDYRCRVDYINRHSIVVICFDLFIFTRGYYVLAFGRANIFTVTVMPIRSIKVKLIQGGVASLALALPFLLLLRQFINCLHNRSIGLSLLSHQGFDVISASMGAELFS